MQDFYGFLKGESGYIQRDYAYDVYDRVVSMKYWNSKNPDKILEEYEYTYDKNSNILSSYMKLIYEDKGKNQRDGKVTTVQENEYNGDGKRISKTENGIKTCYFYEGDTLLYTTDDSGNKTSQNIIGLEGNTDFYNEICYTGGVYDETTGLYYLNARYYNPEKGVFLSQDTYRGDEKSYNSWNLYAYCTGNPIKYVDPSGHWIDIIADAIGFAVDAYAFIKDPSVENGIFLAVDVAMVLLPCVTGASIVRTSIKKGGKVVASSKYGTKTKTVRSNIKQAGKKVIAKYGGKKIAKKAVKKKISLTFRKLKGKVKEANRKIHRTINGFKKSLKSSNPKTISKMSKKQIKNNLPSKWTYSEHDGFVHVKDAKGNIRVRIDPPDKITKYDHMHVYDNEGNLLDINGRIVSKNDPAGHIKWNKK